MIPTRFARVITRRILENQRPADHVSTGLLRVVAGQLRSGTTLRAALGCLHADAPHALQEPLLALKRRLALGQPLDQAVRQANTVFGGRTAFELASLATVHQRHGGDLAAMLDALADRTDAREAALQAARGACAGALLSGRIIAGLPLLLLMLTPELGAVVTDGGGAVGLTVGAILVTIGMGWMRHLVPKVNAVDDPVASSCDIVASVLAAGSSLHTAMAAAVRTSPLEIRPEFDRAQRMVRLGASWPQALARCDHGDLADLSLAIGHAERLGIPLANSLGRWAEVRRQRRVQRFELAVRRAPVLMVIPLTVCVLPAYVILGLGPLMHGY